MGSYDVYKDIGERTNGLIYLGVVGPVRTGKSTFIERFMDLMVIPGMEDVHSRERAIDELPQSAQGKTIMTTEPKFIPKEGAEISFGDATAKVRLIDCVGFMVNGAAGHIENEKERMVKTPWFEHEIPFTQAAEIGTQKVIREHSTIGIVVTTDGSFGELPRESYREAEEKTVAELKKIGKPFVVIVNTNRPYAQETAELVDDIKKRLSVEALAVDCDQLKKEDVTKLLERLLSVFPLTRIDFYMPKWVEMLENTHPLKQAAIKAAKKLLSRMTLLRDVKEQAVKEVMEQEEPLFRDSSGEPYIRQCKIETAEIKTGTAAIRMEFDDRYYYRILSDMAGTQIDGEYQLISTIRQLSSLKQQYEKIAQSYQQVRMYGYGVVTPLPEEITLEEPEIIRHGNKFGVKIRANAPSVHMIQANIETEIAPILGSEEQAQDLIRYLQENGKETPQGVWETNIFGKTLRQLVDEGMESKVHKMTEESRMKLQETIQKVINDSNGGLVCIII